MPIVIRIGGSVIASPTNPELINQYTKLFHKLRRKGYKIVTIVGGGALAREFIQTGNKLSLSQEAQDWLAIHVSRFHALLLTLKLAENGTETVPTSISEAVQAFKKGKIVVMGGLQPGMTTDAVAAHIAKKIKAQLLVKATDQDGVYDKDPRKHEDAKKLDAITYSNLTKLLEQSSHKAGIHQILDPVAVKILQKTSIKTVVVNGYDPKNIQHAIEGKKIGTTIME
jgi:uridylate kinase